MSEERLRIFPFAKIECARFKGTQTKVFLDQATVEGPIHTTVESCLAFIKRNIVLAPIFKELKLIEAWGTGIQKMLSEVANYPGIRLVLQEAGHAFHVQFVKTRAQEAQVGPKRPKRQPK